MRTAPFLDEVRSRGFDSVDVDTSVVVATANRVGFLDGLVAALERQTASGFELLVVVDGSQDGTWERLQALAGSTTLPLRALRIAATGGPSVPRNTGVSVARGELLLFTDDDCLPEPAWVGALRDALAGNDLARGPVHPTSEPHGAWDRSIDVPSPTPWYETANLGVRRTAFLAAGGFPVLDVLGSLPAPRGFGEDVVFGHRAADGRREGWAPTAVVRHRWVAGSYLDHLRGRRRLVGFPALKRVTPRLASVLPAGAFLGRRSLAFDVAAAAAGAAALTRQPWLLAGAVPWARLAWPDARARGGRSPWVRLVQLAVADAVGAAALVEGSVRHRAVVL